MKRRRVDNGDLSVFVVTGGYDNAIAASLGMSQTQSAATALLHLPPRLTAGEPDISNCLYIGAPCSVECVGDRARLDEIHARYVLGDYSSLWQFLEEAVEAVAMRV